MEFSQMTQKWSSKPKEDRAARVRENQRRHRARTKAYISELEEELADTKAKLEQALSRNTALEAEVDRLRHPEPATVPAVGGSACAPAAATAGISNLGQTAASGPPSFSSIPGPIADDLTHDASLLLALSEEQLSNSSAEPPSPWSSNGTGSPHPTPAAVSYGQTLGAPSTSASPAAACDSSAASSLTPCACDSPAVSPQNSTAVGAVATSTPVSTGDPDCTHLPPPAPGESTIHCKTAYRIIEERNFKEMDPSEIKSWLGPGYRRAIIQGDGCRVDSHLVFALIDDISAG